ncbi:TPA: drug:proton antiporter, partial [Staphylococcus aureus]|nr:drug:proton antiporter [Staphylococcus aureus]
QNLLHRSALDSGLTLLPGAIVMAFMSMTSGALYEKFGPRKLALVGMAIVVITTAYFVVMDEQTSTIMLATVYAIRMVGIALGLIPVMTHTMNQIKIDTMLHGYHAGFLFALLITVISFFCSFMLQGKKKEVDSHQ